MAIRWQATRRLNMRCIAAAALALAAFACRSATGPLPSPPSPSDAIPLAALPALGQPLPFQAPPMFRTVVSASNMEDAWFVRVEGVVYEAAVDPEGRVSYVSTSDPSFRTPEGLRVGIGVDEVRAAGATHFAYEYTAGCSAELPSGWRAGAEFVGQPLICKAQISWFFKR